MNEQDLADVEKRLDLACGDEGELAYVGSEYAGALVAEVRRLRAWLKWMAYNEFSEDAARALRGDDGPAFMDSWAAPTDVSVVNWSSDEEDIAPALRGDPAPESPTS